MVRRTSLSITLQFIASLFFLSLSFIATDFFFQFFPFSVSSLSAFSSSFFFCCPALNTNRRRNQVLSIITTSGIFPCRTSSSDFFRPLIIRESLDCSDAPSPKQASQLHRTQSSQLSTPFWATSIQFTLSLCLCNNHFEMISSILRSRKKCLPRRRY